jgi:hypothetical protein
MRTALPHRSIRPAALAALVASVCALSGCFLTYFPMLLLVPFMPLLKLAVHVAAKYGPLLLLLVEADPTVVPGEPQTMIAMRPAQAPHCAMVDLETQLVQEVTCNPNVRRITLLEAERLTPEWLAAETDACAARGERLTVVFVDSRRFAEGSRWSPATDAALRDSGIELYAGEGLAHQVAGPAAPVVAYASPRPMELPGGASAVLASVAACDAAGTYP